YVFIIDRHKEELDLALSEIGKNVEGIEGDVSNLLDLDKLYNIVKVQKGRMDTLLQMRVLYNSLQWEESLGSPPDLGNTSTSYSVLM
ncbi:MAG: hypothetical protein WBZ36_06580, partial [Candidatus Nitrosopolaris sp.]